MAWRRWKLVRRLANWWMLRRPLGPIEVVSFDVFDTVVTRRTGSPRRTIDHVAHLAVGRFPSLGDGDAVSRARHQAEVTLFGERGHDDGVDLQTIWERALADLGVDDVSAEALVAHELELEARTLEPVPQAVASLAGDVGAAQHVAFSDTYLDEAELRHLVAEAWPAVPEQVLSSCSSRASKHTGAGFDLLRKRLGTDRILHIGNNFHSDVDMAFRSGVRARYAPAGNLTEDEGRMDASGRTGALMAGAMRSARLAAPCEDPDLAARRRVAIQVAAPILLSWAVQIVRDAQRAGLRELIFVTRDGCLLSALVERVASRMGVTLACRLLAGSRQSWLPPAASGDPDVWLPVLFQGKRDVDGLDPDVVAARLGIHIDRDDELWQVPEASLPAHLASRPDILAAFTSAQQEATELAGRYLLERNVGGNGPYGFVDLGTRGTLLAGFTALTDTYGMRAPEAAYYWGWEADAPMLDCRPTGYLWDAQAGDEEYRRGRMITFLETVCTAPHGSVSRYAKVDGRVEPVFAEAANAQVAWGRDAVIEGVLAVADRLVVDGVAFDPDEDLRPAIVSIFDRFWENPTREEAAAWGSFPFEDGWAGSASFAALAPPVSPLGLARAVAKGTLRHPHRHAWEAGRVRNSSPVMRVLAPPAARIGARLEARRG